MNNPHINTFAVTIVDSKNQKTLMYNVSCGKGVEKYLEFHGLRGAGDVIIPFSKVKSVEIMGKVPATSDLYSSNPHVNTVFHLIDGHSIIVAIPGKWKWRGETAFGELSINTEDLKVITFHHEGSAMRCSQCGKIFHIEGFQYCPYDGKKMDEISE